MTTWTPEIRAKSGPKYLAIFQALQSDIRSGRLPAGHRLPPQRDLAKTLGVDLTTVTRAFNEARRVGLIEASGSRGSYVRRGQEPTPETHASTVVDLSMNMPPQPGDGMLRQRIQDGIAGLLSAPNGWQHLQYQASLGSPADRAAGAHWLHDRLGRVDLDRVAVAPGAQTALYAIMRSLARPGEVVCCGALTYPGLIAVARQLGIRLAPVAMDTEGIIPTALEETCVREQGKAVYCVPTIDNPTTATMPIARRREVAEVARRRSLAVIEDDAYGMLPRAAPPPLAAIAPDVTWHISTLSKCLTPALRTAYVVAPGIPEMLRLASELRAVSLMTPPLTAALATSWILDGSAHVIASAVRAEVQARQQIASRILSDFHWRAHPEGHHLWLTLPEASRSSDLDLYARQLGLAVVTERAFAVGQSARGLRVSLGAARDRHSLERGLVLLAEIITNGERAISAVV